MTEAQWLSNDNPGFLLAWLLRRNSESGTTAGEKMGNRVSDRKLAAFCRACESKANRLIGWNEFPTPAEHAWRWAVGNEWGAVCPLAYRAAILRDIVDNPFRQIELPCAWKTRNTNGSVTYHDCPWLTPDVLFIAQAADRLVLSDGTLDPQCLRELSDALEEGGCDAPCPMVHPNGGHRWKTGMTGNDLLCAMCEGTGRIAGPIIEHLRQPSQSPCHCVSLWSGLWDDLPYNRIGLYGGSRTVAKKCPSCGETGVIDTPHVRGCHVIDLILGKE